MKKVTIFLSMLSIFLIIILPNIPAVEYYQVQNINTHQLDEFLDIDISTQFKKFMNLNDDKADGAFLKSSLFQDIIDIIIFLFTTFFTVLGSIISISAEIFGSIVSIIGSIISITAQIIGSIVNILFSLIGPMINILFRLIGKVVNVILNILGVIIKLIGGSINIIAKITGTLLETVGQIIERIINFLFSNNLALHVL